MLLFWRGRVWIIIRDHMRPSDQRFPLIQRILAATFDPMPQAGRHFERDVVGACKGRFYAPWAVHFRVSLEGFPEESLEGDFGKL